MCHFDMTPSRTNDVSGECSIRIVSTKAIKKGFTMPRAVERSYQHSSF